ncbi:MAG: DUF2934 domain-containing protein [Hydrogenophaga sp.]|uniref:DUF2934 domain-containing protein n=1 Tax=Hydrogenophaga sp. TaxID=1904254 RepID=UPI00262D1836|nr:DUF2934 domain-containing protein [Hydrogenophaga sp.]MDM7944289.1 DUF2934 domain-containing protein [Hydrogenophaga sp.]
MKQLQDKPTRKQASSRTGKRVNAAQGATPATDSMAGHDSFGVERIHAVAYGFYEARGCVDGHDLDDWLAAEAAVAREVQGSRSGKAAADH